VDTVSHGLGQRTGQLVLFPARLFHDVPHDLILDVMRAVLRLRLGCTLARGPASQGPASPVRPGCITHGGRGSVLLLLQLLGFHALRRQMLIDRLLFPLLALVLRGFPPGLLLALLPLETLEPRRVHVRRCRSTDGAATPDEPAVRVSPRGDRLLIPAPRFE